MSIETEAAAIRDEFAFLDDWETRYAHLIDLGKALPPLDASERSETNRVRGCASNVWLVADAPDSSETLTLRAESDAAIVSGLIALLLRLYSGRPRSEISTFDIEGLFDEIGVRDAITAQRANGLTAMVSRIRALAT